MKHVQFDGANFENVDFRSCTFLRGASFHGITITKGNLDLRGVMVGDPNRSDLPTLIGFAGFRLAPYSTIKLWLELSYGACALFNQGELLGDIEISVDPTRHRDDTMIRLQHLKGTGSVTIASPRLEALPKDFKTRSPMILIDDVDNVRFDRSLAVANLVAYANLRDQDEPG